MFIVVYFNNTYFKWSEILFKSIEKYEPQSKIYVHGYNLTTRQAARLHRWNNVVEVVEDVIEENTDISRPHYKKDKLIFKPLRFQITCSKGQILLDATRKYKDEDLYVLMDIDMMFLKSISGRLQKVMRDKDVGLSPTRVHHEGKLVGKVKGGFIITNKNKRSLNFWKTYCRFVNDGILYYNKDQICLYNAYKKVKAKYLELNHREYMNPNAKNPSSILSAHKSIYGNKEKRFYYYKKLLEKRTRHDQKRGNDRRNTKHETE